MASTPLLPRLCRFKKLGDFSEDCLSEAISAATQFFKVALGENRQRVIFSLVSFFWLSKIKKLTSRARAKNSDY